MQYPLYIYIYILWTVDGKIPEPPWTVEPYNGINHLPTGEGFLPSTVCTHIYIYIIFIISHPQKKVLINLLPRPLTSGKLHCAPKSRRIWRRVSVARSSRPETRQALRNGGGWRENSRNG